MKEDENYASVCVCVWLLLCSLWASQPFLLLVIKSTVAITRVIMDISLIYNPCRLLRIGGCEGGRSVGGQVGGLGVQNYPHAHLSCYYLLLKVKVVVMMTKKTFYSNREQSKCHPSKYSHRVTPVIAKILWTFLPSTKGSAFPSNHRFITAP